MELQLQHQSFQYLGLISFRTDWFDLLDSQESSLTPQFKSINYSALSFLYGPTLTVIHDTEKTIALIIQIFVGKVMSLLLIYYLGFS